MSQYARYGQVPFFMFSRSEEFHRCICIQGKPIQKINFFLYTLCYNGDQRMHYLRDNELTLVFWFLISKKQKQERITHNRV